MMVTENTKSRKIESHVWDAGMLFEQYIELLEKLLAEGKTTGPLQTPEKIEHARLNLIRMKRIAQQFEPDPETIRVLQSKPDGIRILFIVEGWCGDAAQIVPALNKIVLQRGWESRFILRDEHPEVMDMFLTNGTRSIPAAVALDEDGTVLTEHWGPRPVLLQALVDNWKAEMSKDDWHRLMHTWYAKNKSMSLQEDFADWVSRI